MNWRCGTVKMGVNRRDDCGMRISDCGFKHKNRGAVVDEWLGVFFMTMVDSVNELSERSRDKFSICYYQSEIRSPKSEIRNLRPEDARKDAHIRGRSSSLMKYPG